MSKSYSCVFCGKLPFQQIRSVPPKRSDFQEILFDTWKAECAKTLIDYLLTIRDKDNKGKFMLAFNYFKSSEYCFPCLQSLRDLNFLAKKIEQFQNKLQNLLGDIRTNIEANYSAEIENSIKNDPLARRTCWTVIKDVKKLDVNYSQKEVKEAVYMCFFSNDSLESRISFPKDDESNVTIECKVDPVNFETESEDHSPISEVSAAKSSELCKIEPTASQMSVSIDVISDFDDDNLDDSFPQSDYKDDQPLSKRNEKRRAKLQKISYEETSRSFSDEGNEASISKPSVRKETQNLSEECPESTTKRRGTDYCFFCRYCNKDFREVTELKEHLSTSHQGSNPYLCAFCTKVYTDYRSLCSHTKACHCFYDCLTCGKTFSEKRKYTLHLKSHENDSSCKINTKSESSTRPSVVPSDLSKTRLEIRTSLKHTGFSKDLTSTDSHNEMYSSTEHDESHNPLELFTCSECFQEFTSQSKLNSHVKVHTTNFGCDKCQKTFKSFILLKKHKFSHVIDRPIICDQCGNGFKCKNDLKSHMVSHKNKTKPFQKFGKLRSRYNHFCKFCGKGYETEDEINNHYSAAHQGPNPFSCAFCSEIFSNSVNLRRHTKKEHPSPEDIKQFQCHICPKTFKRQTYLKDHLKFHGDPSLLFKCTQCPKVFSVKKAFEIHTETHNTEIRFICETCGKGFNHSMKYKKHLVWHATEKLFKCAICDRGFCTLQACQRHEIVHTDIKEHICDVCNKAFALYSNLFQHKKLHVRVGNDPIRKRKEILTKVDKQYIKKL